MGERDGWHEDRTRVPGLERAVVACRLHRPAQRMAAPGTRPKDGRTGRWRDQRKEEGMAAGLGFA